MTNIEELKKKYEELGAEIERLEGESKPLFSEGEEYFRMCIDWYGREARPISNGYELSCEGQGNPNSIGMFKTEEEARRCANEVQTVIERHTKIARGEVAR